MQKPVNQRQLAWVSSLNILTAENFLEFAEQLLSISEFGAIQNPIITFSGGALPIQLTGPPSQVRAEFEQLSDKRFTSVNFKGVFPNVNNLNITISANLSAGNINVSIQNGTDEHAERLFQLALQSFPRATGPSDQEIEQQLLRLSALIKEAEKAVEASKEAQQSSKYSEEYKDRSEKLLNIIQTAHSESNKIFNNLKQLAEESAQKANEIANLKNQAQVDRDTTEKLRNDIGAIEAKIREFFNEIETTKKDITDAKNLADITVKTCKDETDKIIQKNQKLQIETKEHLLKAVGASLFSAFEKRKKRIEISKWIWAGLTALAIVAQVIVIIWIANHVKSLPTDVPFYKIPSFLLRVTVSIPILFFIGYSVHQYAREREYEELYGFKSSLSFSLSPYLDLVRKLQEEGGDTNKVKWSHFFVQSFKHFELAFMYNIKQPHKIHILHLASYNQGPDEAFVYYKNKTNP